MPNSRPFIRLGTYEYGIFPFAIATDTLLVANCTRNTYPGSGSLRVRTPIPWPLIPSIHVRSVCRRHVDSSTVHWGRLQFVHCLAMQSVSSRGKMPTGMTSPKTGSPAPYGHACTNCAKAKCKCIHRQAGGACERYVGQILSVHLHLDSSLQVAEGRTTIYVPRWYIHLELGGFPVLAHLLHFK